jgi:hypothetical protein
MDPVLGTAAVIVSPLSSFTLAMNRLIRCTSVPRKRGEGKSMGELKCLKLSD